MQNYKNVRRYKSSSYGFSAEGILKMRLRASVRDSVYSGINSSLAEVLEDSGFVLDSVKGREQRIRSSSMRSIIESLTKRPLPVLSDFNTLKDYELACSQTIEEAVQFFVQIENQQLDQHALRTIREALAIMPIVNKIRGVTGNPNTDFNTTDKIGGAKVAVNSRHRQWESTSVLFILYVISSVYAYDRDIRSIFNQNIGVGFRVPSLMLEKAASYGSSIQGAFRITNELCDLPDDFLAGAKLQNTLFDLAQLRVNQGLVSQVKDIFNLISDHNANPKFVVPMSPFVQMDFEHGFNASGDLCVVKNVHYTNRGITFDTIERTTPKGSDQPKVVINPDAKVGTVFSRFVDEICFLPSQSPQPTTHAAHILDTFTWCSALNNEKGLPIPKRELTLLESTHVDANGFSLARAICLRVKGVIHNQSVNDSSSSVPEVAAQEQATTDTTYGSDVASTQRTGSKRPFMSRRTNPNGSSRVGQRNVKTHSYSSEYIDHGARALLRILFKKLKLGSASA